jgi:hypothetical protein
MIMAAGAMLLPSLGLLGCSDNIDGGEPTCRSVGGVWTVVTTLDNGLKVPQQWTIEPNGCDLVARADPPDTYGPFLGTGATGNIYGDDAWLRWSQTVNNCRYSAGVDGRFTGPQDQPANALTGTFYWVRVTTGAGGCSAGSGSGSVTGSR